MALVKRGNPLMHLQPGWIIDEDEHGLLTGECSFEGDFSSAGTVPNGILHPYDSRLTAFRRKLTRLPANKARVTLSFIGVSSDPTPMIIEHPGGSGQDDITTHPDFLKFAGTPAAPKNGAQFDLETGEFIGFLDPSKDLVGVRSYIVPSLLVNLTFYSHYVPQLNDLGTRYNEQVPDLIKPSNVKNFLLVGMPYKRIGNLFQITHQIIGSGPKGWNTKIYG